MATDDVFRADRFAMPSQVAVLHLVRYGNADFLLKRFIKSYQRHASLAAHRLIFILKGFQPSQALEQKKYILEELDQAEFIEVSDEGFDVNAYRTAANECDAEYVMFLNSHSTIEVDHWLEKFLTVFQEHPTAGLVGATGNWESVDARTPFPNAHIRSNGFMIRRDIFVDLIFGALDTKDACSQFEAGENSMMKQIIARQLEPFVVGRDGQAYPPESWPDARIFRSGKQENLLIADNRTRDYANGSARHRQKVARLSWHEKANVPSLNLLQSAAMLVRRITSRRF